MERAGPNLPEHAARDVVNRVVGVLLLPLLAALLALLYDGPTQDARGHASVLKKRENRSRANEIKSTVKWWLHSLWHRGGGE